MVFLTGTGFASCETGIASLQSIDISQERTFVRE
jgi:hypothetical protein